MTGPVDDRTLTARVDQLDNGLRVISERLDEHEDAVAESVQELSTELDSLRDDLDALIEKESEPKEDPVPLRWAARATQQDWDKLIGWVDGLRVGYSVHASFVVPACWIAHPGVVEELAGLYRGWVSAVLTDEAAGSEGSSALTAWHDRWLWPALHRFKESRWRTTNCDRGHRPEDTAAVAATDRSHLPPVSAMAVAKPSTTTPAGSSRRPGRA